MAERPVFISTPSGDHAAPMVSVVSQDFQWYPGMALSQRQKSITSLHHEFSKTHDERVLDVSRRSTSDLGVALSAFNLSFTHGKESLRVSVESAFQGSKLFEGSGPHHYLYRESGKTAKKRLGEVDERVVRGFSFFGEIWPATPPTMFYDWVYINTLWRDHELRERVLEYGAFTDIEFNPKKSLNCQAHACALYVSLSARGLIKEVVTSRSTFEKMYREQPTWIIGTKYAKYHRITHW